MCYRVGNSITDKSNYNVELLRLDKVGNEEEMLCRY